MVRSSKGLEAAAWVIAETTDFPTKYAKIVLMEGGKDTKDIVVKV